MSFVASPERGVKRIDFFCLTDETLSLILNHMVKYSQLDSTFGALADPTRRAILASLMLGQSSITALARPHRMSLPAVMKHIRVLEEAGLVSQEKTGRTRHCRLAAEPLKQAEDWISQYRKFWEGTFDSLERFLNQPEDKSDRKEDQQWQHRKRSRKPRSR
jgi:DNA-binding transcriptional ArsR family regulator